ncbi:unnamed protein product [Chironomus riparius]|uniref:Uncharacterized protein n=1 Tax=Chironomus riparius TaxID=315576 RepID=A0A9N9RQI5_9DIPT|nr:unnamed protein product [Chironomus riparius]
MKLIFVFALIAAVSCDVSHIVQGDGWFKDETGYHYTQPAAKFDEAVAEEYVVVDEPALVAEPEPVVVEVPFETPVEAPLEEVVVADEPTPVEAVEAVEPEVVAEVLADPVEAVPEVKVNNEYLPPVAPADAKKKRQTPVRRVIRKVYRRFVPVKRH